MSARRALVDWHPSLFIMCKAWHQYNERPRALALLNSLLVRVLIFFSLSEALLLVHIYVISTKILLAWVYVFRIIPEFKMLNSAGKNSFSALVSVYLKVFDH